MRWKKRHIAIIATFVFYYFAMLYFLKTSSRRVSLSESQKNKITIVTNICAMEAFNDTIVMIKTALLFKKSSKLHFVLFVEESPDKLFLDLLKEKIDEMKLIKNSFTYEIQDVISSNFNEKWVKNSDICANLQLFLPDLLINFEKVLYVNSDIIFLNNIEDIWLQFDFMDSYQLAGMVPNALHNVSNIEKGLNSAVILMDLKKMREYKWTEYVVQARDASVSRITKFDQDIINVIFYNNPEKFYELPCRYNYEPQHCLHSGINKCKSAEKYGIQILRRHSSAFYNSTNNYEPPIFYVTFVKFLEFFLEDNVQEYLIKPLRAAWQEHRQTACGHVIELLEKNLVVSLPEDE